MERGRKKRRNEGRVGGREKGRREGRKKKMKFVPSSSLKLNRVTGVSGLSLKDLET